MRHEEFDKAIAQFTEVIRLDPKNAAAYANRGETYGHKGELDKRIADDSEAIRLDPKNAAAYDNRGSAHREKGENDKAIADYTEAIRLNPKHVWSYYERALAYEGKGEDDKAIAGFSEAIRLKPDYIEAYYQRALAYAGKGENDKAIADWSEVVRLDPRSYSHRLDRGQAYFDKGLLNEARADFSEALRLEPADPGGASRAACRSRPGKRRLRPRDRRRVESRATRRNRPVSGTPAFWRRWPPAGLATTARRLAEMVERLGKGEDPNAARLVTWACVVKPDFRGGLAARAGLGRKGGTARGGSAHAWPRSARCFTGPGRMGGRSSCLSEADRLLRDPSEIAVNSPAYTWFFLAMANHRLGHAAEAKKWLDKAGQWSDLAARELQAACLPTECSHGNAGWP